MISFRFFSAVVRAFVLIAVSSSCLLGQAPSETNGGHSPISFEGVLDQLKKRDFNNVTFKFTLWETQKEPLTAEAKRTYWSQGKMWLSGVPNSLLKIEYSPRVTTWTNGAAPYLQRNQTIAFNGKYWLSVVNQSGAIDSTMVPVKTAEISETSPAGWEAPRWDSPENFLLSHISINGQPNLIKLLERLTSVPVESRSALSRKFLIENDGDLVKFSIHNPNRDTPEEVIEIWLDPSKGGALKRIRQQYKTPSDRNWSEQDDVVETFADAGGIWMPAKAKRKYKSHEREIVLTFEGSDFQLFDESSGAYEVNLLAGTRVRDLRNNGVFVVGRDVDTTLRAIESEIKQPSE